MPLVDVPHYETDEHGFKRKVPLKMEVPDDLTGKKWDQGKVDWSLLPSRVMEDVLHVYMGGAAKYGRGNYQKGIKFSRVFSAALRHLWSWWRGEEFDEESGLSHLAHAAWNVLTLLEYHHGKSLYDIYDDRKREFTFPDRPIVPRQDAVFCEHMWVYETSYAQTGGLYTRFRCGKCGATQEQVTSSNGASTTITYRTGGSNDQGQEVPSEEA